jgi:hypothetical protein
LLPKGASGPVIGCGAPILSVSWANDGIEMIAKNKTATANIRDLRIISSFKKFDELKKTDF